ncbi:cyclase family protein [Spirilliplanes yamanashiensis]|nr:cyclase family protein [Spirilliplanes yamanashiensis]MDP9818924.1 kynurenine formamidase [Spirilliplanes yamanashiensis]
MCTEECLQQSRAGRLSRRAALTGAAAAAAGLVAAAPAQASPAPAARLGSRLRDLTYPLTTTFPAFAPGEEAAKRTWVTIEDDGYYLQEWRLLEHYGTHVDAPGHFVPGGRTSTELRLDELVTPAVVVDVAARAARDPDTVVTVDDLRAHERRHGRIPRGAAVLMYSGWGARAGDAAAYRGADANGTLHFPGFGAEACEWLLRRRGIRSVGVDTLSIDPGRSTTFDAHLLLAGADRYGLENLANLGRVPPAGATVVVGLIPFQDGSGGQARVFATW